MEKLQYCMSNHIFTGIVLIIGGLMAIIANKRFAKNIILAQNNSWGFQKFGDKYIKSQRVILVLVGLFLLFIGMLRLFDINFYNL